MLADRFGGWPGIYAELPADERAHYLEMLGIEVRVARATADLGPDDELAPDFFDEDEDGPSAG